VPSFVGFRYGDDHHALIGIWVREVEEGTTLDQCLEQFEKWAEPQTRTFGVRVEPGPVTRLPWSAAPAAKPEGPPEVLIKTVEAEIDTIFAKGTYVGAYAAYAMWPKTCTVFGVAVAARDNIALARQVRQRYVTDGFSRIERHNEAVPSL
jgi:hypothetical protein